MRENTCCIYKYVWRFQNDVTKLKSFYYSTKKDKKLSFEIKRFLLLLFLNHPIHNINGVGDIFKRIYVISVTLCSTFIIYKDKAQQVRF